MATYNLEAYINSYNTSAVFASLYDGSAFYISISNDYTNWTSIGEPYTVANCPTALALLNNELFVGTNEGQIYSYQQIDSVWTQTGLAFPYENGPIGTLIADSGNLYVVSITNSLYCSFNSGTDWNDLSPEIPFNQAYASDGTILGIEWITYFPFISTDNGSTWTQISIGRVEYGTISIPIIFDGTPVVSTFPATLESSGLYFYSNGDWTSTNLPATAGEGATLETDNTSLVLATNSDVYICTGPLTSSIDWTDTNLTGVNPYINAGFYNTLSINSGIITITDQTNLYVYKDNSWSIISSSTKPTVVLNPNETLNLTYWNWAYTLVSPDGTTFNEYPGYVWDGTNWNLVCV